MKRRKLGWLVPLPVVVAADPAGAPDMPASIVGDPDRIRDRWDDVPEIMELVVEIEQLRAKSVGPHPDQLLGDPNGPLTIEGANIPNLRAWVAEHADPYIDGCDGTVILDLCDEIEQLRDLVNLTRLNASEWERKARALSEQVAGVRALCAVRGISHAPAILIYLDHNA